MSKNPYRQDREELKALLDQYRNMKDGVRHSFIDEDDFERIIDHFEEKDQFQLGLEAATIAITQYPYSGSLLTRKAGLLIATHKYREALAVLEHSELYDNTDTLLYILKTEAYLALDLQEKAAEVLVNALEFFEGEEKVDLLFELADVYDDYENFEKVFDCLKLILELDPTSEEALYKICFWTDFTGRNEESIRLHQQIIEDHPFCELAWFNLGAAYQGLKLYEKCIDAYQYAIAIDEKFDFAYRNLGDAFIKLRKYREAIEALEKVIEFSMPEAVIYEAIGHCYDRLENFAQARFHYRKACHLSPEDGHLFYRLASTYMNEGNFSQAVKILENPLKKTPHHPDYNLAMGRCRMEMGEILEAVICFGLVVKARPKNATGWTDLLRCLYKGELFEEGLEYSVYALAQLDQKPIFIFFQSAFLLALGKTKEALLQLDTAMSQNPKLIRQFIEINPAFLQNQQIVEIIARHKNRKQRH